MLPGPILAGVPFIKNVEIPKFWSAPQPAPPSGPIFSGRGPKIEIPLPTFCLPRCPNSEKVRHDPPAPKPPEEIDSAETRFFGVQAWPHRPRGLGHPHKNYLRGVKCALKILRRSVQRFKSYGTFSKWRTDGQTDRHTDTQTKANHLSTTTEIFFAYMWGRRRETLQTLLCKR